MIVPDRRSLQLLGVWLGLGVLASLVPALVGLWWAAGLLIALLLGVEAVRLATTRLPEVTRRVPPALSMGAWTRAELSLDPHRDDARGKPAARTLELRLHDRHPPRLQADGLPQSLRLAPGQAAVVGYRLRPEERGQHHFGLVDLAVASPWGLLERRLQVAARETVRVYPNFRAVARYQLLATDRRTRSLGIRRRPRRGEGLDFHQLREYREGDSLRQIDWKSTARLRRAISREYQDERDQQIVFLLDCGRRMHAHDGATSHFDAALDALLLLAHVALRQGDAVGLMTFAGEQRWLAPRKGASQLNALMNSVYDLRTGPRASDYLVACRDVASKIRKRALVVLVSNLRDEDSDELAAGLRLLSRRHLVLLASLREAVLGRVLCEPVHDLEGALRLSATHLYLGQRRRAQQRLRGGGALLLDSEPAELPVRLVNGYFDIKSAGVL